MSAELYSLIDDLELNLTVKRHHKGVFDARIYHPWFHNPILSSCGKSSYEECIQDMASRIHAIENMRVGIQRKNEQRTKKYAENVKNGTRDAEEYSVWGQWG